ncbi:Aminodeoxychorismate synthase component 1 [compost metagenome]
MKILLIDNFDSFTRNIAQYLYEVTGTEPVVVPNTRDYDALDAGAYDAIVLSPGPGHPEHNDDFGVCAHVIAQAAVPMLGICLGHQGIAQVFGGTVEHAPQPVHGYRSRIFHTGTGLFEGLPAHFDVVRYHSLLCTHLPPPLACTAWTEDGLLMALEHLERPIWGVQFHPESIASEQGHALLGNFIRMAIAYNERHRQAVCGYALDAWLAVGGIRHPVLHYRQCHYSGSPQTLFEQHFAEDEHAFWLDCEYAQGSRARYSIMGSGSQPGAIRFDYDLNTECLRISGPAGEKRVHGDCFSLMGQVLQAIDTVYAHTPPFPFKGGLVGFLGYELKAQSGGQSNYCSEYPDAYFIFARHFFVFDHQSNTLYECKLCAKGQLPGWRELVEPPSVGKGRDTAATFRPGAVDQGHIELEDRPDQYLVKIRQALQYIVDGESYEVCLTNRARMSYQGQALEAYQRMRNVSPVPYGAFLACGGFTVLSASPETFLRVDSSGAVESRPIKGTRPRGNTAVEDERLRLELESSQKDRAENLMIVDLVRHDLNQVCRPGTVHVPQLFNVESYSSVHQLVSTIRGVIKHDVPVMEVIRACFPGGSMTGAPKKRTMEIIDTLESSARGIYSGALGWIGFNGEAELSIVIRTAILQGQRVHFGIGGAIVADSDPHLELEETLVKASVPYHSFSKRVTE